MMPIFRLKKLDPVGIAILMAISGSIMLGFSPIFVKLTQMGPTVTAFYRLVLALPVIAAWFCCEHQCLKQDHENIAPTSVYDRLLLLLAGCFFAADLILWHKSLAMTTVMNATLFNNFVPFFVPIVSYILFQQKTNRRFLAAVLLAVIGSLILTGAGFEMNLDCLHGDALALLSAFMFVGYVLIVQRARQHSKTSAVMWWTSLGNAICLGIAACLSGEYLIPSSWNDWVILGCLAIFVHILGQGLLAYSLNKLSAAMAAVTMLVSPIVSTIIGYAVFDEKLTFSALVGAIMIMISIIIAQNNETEKSS